MNVYEDIAKGSRTIMIKEPYYGLLLLSLNKTTSENIPTACVSRNNVHQQLTINPKFWKEQDPATRVGILKHELLHIAFRHLFMAVDYADQELFNIAADFEINQYIQDDFKGPTWNGLEITSPQYAELNLPPKAGTKKYYEILQKNVNKGTCPALDALYNSLKSGTASMHELWKQIQGLSEVERSLIKRQFETLTRTVAEQTIKARGSIPGELKEYIDKLFEVEEPVINWKAYLRQFAGIARKTYTRKTRRRESKRYSDNPAIKVKPRTHILVARDTSGSTSKNDHIEFWNELVHMHRNGIQVTLIDADTGVADIIEFDPRMPFTLKGRGGTDFDSAIEYLNKHHRKFGSMIYLTDGHCDAPKVQPLKKILWVISSNGSIKSAEKYPGNYVQIQR